jgi:hypothetical protein
MRAGFAAVVVLAGVAAAGTASGQDTIRACVKTGQGQIRIVGPADKCLPSESLVEWGLGASAAAPARLGAFRVVDSRDTLVGTVLGGNTVAVPVGSDWVTFSMDAAGAWGTQILWFASGCPDGGALHQGEESRIGIAGSPLYQEGFVVGTRVLYAGATDPAFVPQSYEGDLYHNGTRTCFGVPPGAALPYRFAVTQTLDLSGLAPPFKLVLR